jgi:hypothetical protein
MVAYACGRSKAKEKSTYLLVGTYPTYLANINITRKS